jgi:Ca-activated chloride channel family protein
MQHGLDGVEVVKQWANGYDRLQQEQYQPVKDNDFIAVATNPLSTFSTDVNTASYSNVRRFLTQGRLPPKDAVFLAEMINYFPYTYPQPAGDDPVSLTADTGPCPWNHQHHLARIGVKARQIDTADTPPRNLVFLIDSSGSMSGETRLPLVKKSLHLLIERLRPRDVVSIVTYAGDAALKLDRTPGSQQAKIRHVVDALHAGGGTNGGGGIKMAYDQARLAFIEGGVNRVILCTDGDFNVGVTSDGDLVRMIEDQRKSNVFLTCLGYGMGNLKNAKLQLLANHGNGHYAYIDSELEAYKVFVEQGSALTTVAKDVKLQVEFNPRQVKAYRLIGYENRLLRDEDFKNDAKDAGDMGSGHTVTALYEVVPAGVEINLPGVDPLKYQKPAGKSSKAAASGEWLTVKMRYKHPESDTSLQVVKALPVDALGQPESQDFRFAAAVAQFGMLLRDSPYKGTATYAGALEEATAAVGADPGEHRREFLGLVKRAAELTRPKPDGRTAGRD